MLRMPYQKQLKVPVTFPAVLSKSRDYNLIEILCYTIFNYFYTLSKESKNIHNPYRCSTDLLPLLADYYRYQYTDVESVELEREIIATVPELHHNKGCTVGIDNALALSKVDKTNEIRIPWFYDKMTNTVYVVLSSNIKTYKLNELLKLVVPIGTKVIINAGYFVESADEVNLHSWTEVNAGPLSQDKQYCIVPNKYWNTVWNKDTQKYSVYVDEQGSLGNPNNTLEKASSRIGNTEVANNTLSEDNKD